MRPGTPARTAVRVPSSGGRLVDPAAPVRPDGERVMRRKAVLDDPAARDDRHPAVHDELSGETWTWAEHNYVRLDPFVAPAHVFVVRRASQ